MAKQRPVLFVENSTGVGGSTISLLRLAGNMQSGEYQPHVLFYSANDYLPKFRELGVETIVLSQHSDPVRQFAAIPRTAGPKGLRRLGGASRRLIRRDIPGALRIRKLIRQKGAQLVHINGRFSSCHAAILAARLARVPCICHVRDFYSFGPLDRSFARWIRLFVYISGAVQVHTEQILPGAAGQLVYDGIDEAEFRETPGTRKDREDWVLGRRGTLAGNVGRLVEWKGQHIFLEAIAGIAGDVPGLKAVVVGDPDPPWDTTYLDRLNEMTRRLRLQSRVTFSGFVEDLPQLLSTFDLLVHSSVRPEPFGLTILEGMAAGLPVVASAAGGVLDLVQDGITGRLVPPADAHSLGQTMLEMLTQRDRASRLGHCAREYVADHFTIRQFVGGIERAYASVLS